MPRLEFTTQTKRDAFTRACGICECHLIPWLRRPNGCGVKLRDGQTFYEHINPAEIKADNSIENCATLCLTCWREKTDHYDRKIIAQSNHKRDRARGIRQRSSLPGGRDDPRKRTMRGEVVDRRTGERWGWQR